VVSLSPRGFFQRVSETLAARKERCLQAGLQLKVDLLRQNVSSKPLDCNPIPSHTLT